MPDQASARGATAKATGVVISLVVVLALATVGYFAVRAPGYASTSVQGVRQAAWVTSNAARMVGLLNKQSGEIQSPAYVDSAKVELYQVDNRVVVADTENHTLQSLDATAVTLSGKLRIPESASIALSASTVAVADRKTGSIWVLPADGLGTGDLTGQKPNATAAPGAVIALAGSTVYAIAPGSDKLVAVSAGKDSAASSTPLAGGPLTAATLPTGTSPSVAITTVGDTSVVLDAAAKRIAVGDKSFALPAGIDQPVLQQPGPASSTVLVADRGGLHRIDLSTGAVTTQATPDSGTPAQPVLVAGCAHGAWAGARPQYLAWCDGVDPVHRDIPNGSSKGHLIFRVNGSTVVLNDTVDGNVWVLDADLTLVNNWDRIRASEQKLDSSDAGTQGKADKLTSSRDQCRNGIGSPAPKDDEFGVRPGKPKVLRPLQNDDSSSCSVSVISKVAGQRDGVTAVVVDAGQGIQVQFPSAATAPVKLSYTADNGAGGTGTSTITVSPYRKKESVAPVRVRDTEPSVRVVPGGTVSHQVLDDWVSPSGDELYLSGASSSDADDVVSYSPDGTISVVDSGKAATKKLINFTVTDGSSSAQGTLTVEVVTQDKATLVAAPALAAGVAGQPITIQPLNWVDWPGTDPAQLSKVTKQQAADPVTIAQRGNAVTVTSPTPGSYYLNYQAAAGDAEDTGVIRVNVAKAAGDGGSVVAMTDVAYLPRGGEARVDLTANDSGPAGGILAVQQISTGVPSRLVVRGADLHLVNIKARQALPDGGEWVKYTVTAGDEPVPGWLHVLEVPVSDELSPVARPIAVTVRAGDAVTMDLADHAVDPAGGRLQVAPFPADAIDESKGLLFGTAESIRFLAAGSPSKEPVTLRTQYTVQTASGKRASAPLAITVQPSAENVAPRAPQVALARVFVGGTVDIPLPLAGVDPDGDWAMAAAIDDPAKIGQATVSGTAAVRYTAFETAGVDTFTYTAADGRGGTVTGAVQVLVVALPATAEPPLLPDLTVDVAVGKKIAVDVLAQAVDPSGRSLSFADNPIQVPAGAAALAVVSGGLMVVTAGDTPSTVPLRVTVANSSKRTATGIVTVRIAKTVPAVPPTASDVLVTESMVGADHKSAAVDVGPWVSNPGGVPGDLTVAVPESSKSVGVTSSGKRTLRVPVTTKRQVLAYRVSGSGELTADAFVVVPSLAELNIDPQPTEKPQQQEPEPKPKEPVAPVKKQFRPKVTGKALEVNAGTTVSVKVRDYIAGAARGAAVTVPADGKLSVTRGSGSLQRVDEATLTWVVPEDAGGRAVLTVTVADSTTLPVAAQIPATIIPAKPDPPTLQGQQLDVEVGKSAELNLMDLVSYDKDKLSSLKFSTSGGGQGVNIGLRGNTFTATAELTAAKGTVLDVGVTVSDGINEPVQATFQVRVVGTSAGLSSVPDAELEAAAGQPESINVLDGADDPLGGGLHLVSASDGANYTVSHTENGSVTVTPAADFSGQLTVTVTVGDASNDPDRNVTATLVVTVRGKPAVPGTPAKVSVGDSTATVQWTVPDDNGSPITGYTVSGSNGFSQDCASSPCELADLTNNVTYTFTVIAHNDVGDSATSRRSAAIRPDVAPAAPAAPALTFGDQRLDVSFKAPANTGSDITGYELRISPKPLSGTSTPRLTGTSTTVKGLENGTTYSVSVRALNNSGTPGEFSAAATEIPAAAPGTPTILSVTAGDKAGETKQIAVSWRAGESGGDAPSYVVQWSADGAGQEPKTVGPGATSVTLPAELGKLYKVRVLAKNKAGSAEPSETAEVTPFTAPGQVPDISAAVDGTSQTVNLKWGAAAANGRDITAYQYSTDGNTWDAAGSETSFIVGGLTNGAEYKFRVRACQADGNCGAASEPAPAIPYTKPGTPTNVKADATVAASQLVVKWDAPADNGGRAIAGYQYSVNGAGYEDNGNSQSVTLSGLANGTEYSVVVRAYTKEKAVNLSDPSTQGAGTPYDVPGAITDLRATPGENIVKLEWTDPAANGSPINDWQYRVDGGGWQAITNGANVEANWDEHFFEVRVHNARNWGPTSNAPRAKAWGPVGQAQGLKATSSTPTSVTFDWAPPAPNGIGGWTYQIDGGGKIGATRFAKNTTCGTTVSISVVAFDSAGHPGAPAEASGKAADCPRNPAAELYGWKSADGYIGTSSRSERCHGSNCIMIGVRVSEFKPNTSVRCTWELGSTLTSSHTFTTNGSGAASFDSQTYSGNRPLSVTCSGGGESDSFTLN